ncbi:MAG: (d)CMP kinase, partial [Alphaproteobacteria bacterium]|nr:(d)CMP kinase [Alphaproteobacteria bacterium]
MPVIAVDGPSASGKGTLARRLAEHFGYHWLDTGLLYRAVGARVPDGDPQQAIAVARAFDAAWLGAPELRGEPAGQRASQVSTIPEVRAALLAYQQTFARQSPGAVLDGRDIGTVICPDADVKIFVVADPKVRAYRRTMEARARGEEADEAAVLADIIRRDERDK